MGQIKRQDGLSFIIRTNDHTPPHVHVEKGGGEIKIELGDEETAPRPVWSHELSRKDQRKALDICYDCQEEFLEEWRKVHG